MARCRIKHRGSHACKYEFLGNRVLFLVLELTHCTLQWHRQWLTSLLLYDDNLISSNFTGSSYRMINQQGSLKGVEGIRPAMNEGRLLICGLARRTEENNAKHCCNSFFIV
jgi:hypothetical protein